MLVTDCETNFGTKDLYDVLGNRLKPFLVKKAYYKKSMLWHPDRFSGENKEESETATQKFQTLSGVYRILSDKEKRKIYDESGSCGDEEGLDATFEEAVRMWKGMFKKVTVEDIENFYNEYRNSEEERNDLRTHYERFSGNFNKIMEYTMGCSMDQEDRLRGIIDEMIDEGLLKKTAQYTKSTSKAALRKRKRKNEREAEEAEEALKEIQQKEQASGSSLEGMILAQRQQRAEDLDDFLDQLASKYAKPAKKKSKAQK
ncbi:unnamed protein product, partial [Mesorhabditis spiculigera]